MAAVAAAAAVEATWNNGPAVVAPWNRCPDFESIAGSADMVGHQICGVLTDGDIPHSSVPPSSAQCRKIAIRFYYE